LDSGLIETREHWASYNAGQETASLENEGLNVELENAGTGKWRTR